MTQFPKYNNIVYKYNFLCLKKQKLLKNQPNRQIWAGYPDTQIIDNSIKTTQYDWLTFIPKNLMIQFSKFINMFYIFIMILQVIPEVSNTNGYPMILSPLLFIILVQMAKDFNINLKRYQQDQKENNTKIEIFNTKEQQYEQKKCYQIKVGDLVKVHKNQFLPADLLIIKSSLNDIAYVETKNLDGETNIQTVDVHPQFLKQQNNYYPYNNKDNQKLVINYEKPSHLMYNFAGYFSFKKSLDQEKNQQNDQNINQNTQSILNVEKHYLSSKNLAKRGIKLKNTDYIEGIALYTGQESKIMLNSIKGHQKVSINEKTLQKQTFLLFGGLICICIFCSIYSLVWEENNREELETYVYYGNNRENEKSTIYRLFIKSLHWLLLLYQLIPISLIVTVEMVKLMQSYLLEFDQNFKSQDFNLRVNNSLHEQLGQIDIIFSDKTGTITNNVMTFKCALIGNKIYGSYEDKNKQNNSINNLDSKNIDLEKSNKSNKYINKIYNQSQQTQFQKKYVDFIDSEKLLYDINDKENKQQHNQLHNFLLCITICHNASVQIDTDSKETQFLTSSSDEQALLYFAQQHGYKFQGISNQVIEILINDNIQKFKILQVNEFTSDRKQMSVIVQNIETNNIFMYYKGADSKAIVIANIKDPQQEKMVENIKKSGYDFSVTGLRTLCLGYKQIDNMQFDIWSKKYQQSNGIMDLKEKNIVQQLLQEEIEINVNLLGITGIEDQLQDKVGETITSLKQAGIKIWMLTGDKKETVQNIAQTCQLSTKDTFYIDFQNTDNLKNDIESLNQALQSDQVHNLGLLLSGEVWAHLQESEENKQLFAKYAFECRTVIGYRLSPKEKQQFIDLSKKYQPNLHSLAIGDGANDVSMITAAQIGIGIIGNEGLEAARAGDYAIPQFKHLRRLIFYNGQELYRKNSNLFFFMFYKNICCFTPYMWYGFLNGFVGTQIYDEFLKQLFNLIYTALPIMLYALFDEIYKSNENIEIFMQLPNKLEKMPEKYKDNLQNPIYTNKKFFSWYLIGVIDGLWAFIIGMFIILTFNEKGQEIKLQQQGNLILLLIVTVNNNKVLQMHYSLTGFYIIISILSTGSYILIYYIMDDNMLNLPDIFTDYTLCQFDQTFKTYSTYIAFILITIICNLSYFGYIQIKKIQKIQEKIFDLQKIQPSTFN